MPNTSGYNTQSKRLKNSIPYTIESQRVSQSMGNETLNKISKGKKKGKIPLPNVSGFYFDYSLKKN